MIDYLLCHVLEFFHLMEDEKSGESLGESRLCLDFEGKVKERLGQIN